MIVDGRFLRLSLRKGICDIAGALMGIALRKKEFFLPLPTQY
ncbi:MAG: hypothetical protein ACFFAN_05750 [Promethearchaeota archaeon]